MAPRRLLGLGVLTRARLGGVEPWPDELVDLVVRHLGTLANPVRVRLIDRLRAGESSVAELTATVPTTQQNVSKHLARLHEEGIVSRRKVGREMRYSIASRPALTIVDLVADEVIGHVQDLARSMPGGSPERPQRTQLRPFRHSRE